MACKKHWVLLLLGLYMRFACVRNSFWPLIIRWCLPLRNVTVIDFHRAADGAMAEEGELDPFDLSLKKKKKKKKLPDSFGDDVESSGKAAPVLCIHGGVLSF